MTIVACEWVVGDQIMLKWKVDSYAAYVIINRKIKIYKHTKVIKNVTQTRK